MTGEYALTRDDLMNLHTLVERARRKSNDAVRRLENGGGKTRSTTNAIEHHLDDANLMLGLTWKLEKLINEL